MSDKEVQEQTAETPQEQPQAKVFVVEKEPEQAEHEKRMYDDINKMPAAVADRFKAIAVTYDAIDRIQEEEQHAQRQLELKYEKLY